MNGVTAIANILKMEGVDFVACMPTNPLIEALAIAGIRPIVCRQERTGVHMADGFARITNAKRRGFSWRKTGRAPKTRSAAWPRPMPILSPSCCFRQGWPETGRGSTPTSILPGVMKP